MQHLCVRNRTSVLCILSLLMSSDLSVGAKRPAQSNNLPQAGDLNDWIRARCSDKDVALWVYEGALYDPLEGRRIVNVEGIELVRCVASVGDSSNPESKKQYLLACGDLEVGSLISNENATFEQVSTILTRRLFCYQSPDNPGRLLTSIRLRPKAPCRTIPTRQAVAAYDTATTFIARGKELIAHTEWPDRQSIWGMATRNFIHRGDESMSKDSVPTNSFDFTVYARQKSSGKKPDQLFDLSRPPIDPTLSNATAPVASPRRSKLIEFGTSSSRGKDKFGARETYSYSNIQSSSQDAPAPNVLQRLGLRKRPTAPPPCTVRYSRYGEGPPFFGPGRVCSLELQGRRISSFEELPPLTASLIADRMAPNSFNQTSIQNQLAMEWFRSAPAIQVLPAEDEPSEFWLPDYLRDRGLALWSNWKQRVS